MSADKATWAVGRRKEAVARVRMLPGNGKLVVNGRDGNAYFMRDVLVRHAERGLMLTETKSDYDVHVRVSGGGISGQAGATRMGIARALLKVRPELKDPLRAEGLLTRDPRVVERKKPGRPKARKRFQFSKR